MLKRSLDRIVTWIGLPGGSRETGNLFIAILIGVGAGYGAVLFRFVLRSMQWVFYQHGGDVLTWIDQVPWYLKVGLPALGGLVVGLTIHFFAKEAKGHGVPEVMAAIALKGGLIRKRVAIAKIFASAVTIGSGGSVGREGPMVQIGASIGSLFGQLFRVPSMHMRTAVGCGAAAGIAATFNAPIAGVLFALEIIIGDFGVMSFSPVVLSSVTATVISRYHFGDMPAFIIPDYAIVSLWEYCFYPLLGVIAGLVALTFTTVLYKSEDIFDALKIPEWTKPALGGALLGAVILRFPEIFGVGYGAMNLSLMNHLGLWTLFLLIWIKILASSITLGSGGSGGIFAPSLFIGAMTGGCFGAALNLIFPAITAQPGAYALVAMGGVVAGTTYAPITAIIIIFELTGSYSIILPLMITCITATVLNSNIRRGSIYTIKLLRRGIDLTAGRERTILQGMYVREVMNCQIHTIPEGLPLNSILFTFQTENAPYLHLVDSDGRLTGIISFRDIRGILHEEGLEHLLIAKDIASTKLAVVTPDDTLKEALDLMTLRGISQLPVVETVESMRPVGTLTESALAGAYNQALVRKEISEEE